MHGTLVESASHQASLQISPSSPDPAASPLVFELVPERGGRTVLIALLVPLLIALMTPFWLVVAQLASDPAARAILSARPLIGVQLLVGLVALLWIFGWPLAHFARRGLERRRITIDGEAVHCEAVGLFGARSWTEPIAHYAGLAQRVRTSVSGTRQELVLVHRRRSRSVHLPVSPQIPAETLSSVARLFVLAEIPSREAASVMPLHGYFRLTEPKTQLATA
ncbi:hypothetical protein [uncultured Hyphomicrobium sp.]|uniref:hypothetical protein n=1 Tax=uncultured Hyphomicrobium sp. TaxID=194373 RepID=UPI0025E8FC65|nr:hypothetical protein [uncultured Hyphomicrobium sp.]